MYNISGVSLGSSAMGRHRRRLMMVYLMMDGATAGVPIASLGASAMGAAATSGGDGGVGDVSLDAASSLLVAYLQRSLWVRWILPLFAVVV